MMDEAHAREKNMGVAIGEMEQFQRNVLVELVRDTQRSLQRFTSAIENNTEVVRSLVNVTEGLSRELRYLRKRDGLQDDGSSSSDIHVKGKPTKPAEK